MKPIHMTRGFCYTYCGSTDRRHRAPEGAVARVTCARCIIVWQHEQKLIREHQERVKRGDTAAITR